MNSEQAEQPLCPIRSHWLVAALILVMATAGILVYLVSAPSDAAPSTIERLIRYRLLARNSSNKALPLETVRLFSPHPESGAQRVIDLSASDTFSTNDDSNQNRDLLFSLPLPPFGTKELIISATIALSETPKPAPRPDSRFLASEQFIESEDPQILALAREISAKSSSPAPQALHSWVHENLRQAGYEHEDRGAKVALSQRQGDCTEFSYLLAALLRAQGIPARVVAGFVVHTNRLLRAGEYHNWVEYYDIDRWRIADPFAGIFDAGYQSYISFRILGAGSNMAGAQRFAAASPAIELSF